MSQKNRNKEIALLILITCGLLIVFFVSGYLFYRFIIPFVRRDKGGNETICTMDAKICPDGTTLARDPESNCEFPECPESEKEDENVQEGEEDSGEEEINEEGSKENKGDSPEEEKKDEEQKGGILIASLGPSFVKLEWQDASKNSKYKIYRASSSSGNWTLLSTSTLSLKKEFYDFNPSKGANYYKVEKLDSSGKKVETFGPSGLVTVPD